MTYMISVAWPLRTEQVGVCEIEVVLALGRTTRRRLVTLSDEHAVFSYLPIRYGVMYFRFSRRTWLLFVSAVRAFDTDISPDLLPFSPIFSRISPRVRPRLSLMIWR